MYFRESELEYVDSLNTTSLNEGWLTFNMIDPLSKWVAIPNTNLGLYVSVTLNSNMSMYYIIYDKSLLFGIWQTKSFNY